MPEVPGIPHRGHIAPSSVSSTERQPHLQATIHTKPSMVSRVGGLRAASHLAANVRPESSCHSRRLRQAAQSCFSQLQNNRSQPQQIRRNQLRTTGPRSSSATVLRSFPLSAVCVPKLGIRRVRLFGLARRRLRILPAGSTRRLRLGAVACWQTIASKAWTRLSNLPVASLSSTPARRTIRQNASRQRLAAARLLIPLE
jgi:hypothetical protein